MRSATKEDIGLFKCMHGEHMIRMCRELSAKVSQPCSSSREITQKLLDVLASLTFQKGKRIETVTCVYDFSMLSIKRHFHWPVIELIREVSPSAVPLTV